jgi:hypothetical protein
MKKRILKSGEKELLIKDLLPRIPTGLFVNVPDEEEPKKLEEIVERRIGDGRARSLEDCLDGLIPYLRPLSSMTKEEFEKLKEYSGLKYEQLDLASYQNGTHKCLDFYLSEVPSYVVILVFDWLNEHHFDYRGLISMGLALEAPEEMYKVK